MNQERNMATQPWQARRERALRAASSAAFLFALVFLAAWPWEIFQRMMGGPTLVLGASALIFGFGLVREAALSPKRICLPRGFGLPVALIAVACLQSALHSADPDASKTLAIKYVWYLLLFAMALPLFSRPGGAVLAWRVFALSAGLVGVYAACCAAGWLTPALAGTHEYFGRRLTEELRVGAFVRIAATTPDYNQAILPMLLALPFLLVWAASPGARRAGRAAAGVLALSVVAGVVVSFSRSGLLAVAGVCAGGGLVLVRRLLRGTGVPPVGVDSNRGRSEATSPDCLSAVTPLKGRLKDRRRVWLALGLVAVVLCLAGVLVVGGYSEMLVRRALRGFNSPDPSYRSRFYVFGLAFKLLPQHALFGCGLGASGTVLGAAAEPGKWFGTAIHSMPLLLWFETGILGLAGYLWFWWRVVRRVWTGLVRRPEAERQRLGAAALGALAVLFWMLAVQPFQALSLFPLFAALVIGPACGKETMETPAPTASRAWRAASACALVLVAGLVAGNITLYNRVVARVSAYADALERGLGGERRGDWADARAEYEAAAAIARHADFPSEEAPWHQAPYYADAFRAADLEFLFMRLPGRGGPPWLPGEVAEFSVVRCLWNAGDADEAVKRLDRSLLCVLWPEVAYASAEMHWQGGRLEEAVGDFAYVVEKNRERGPWPPLEYPFDVVPSMDDIYGMLEAEEKALAGSAQPADIARRAAALLRLGRRKEAVGALNAAPANASELVSLRKALGVQ